MKVSVTASFKMSRECLRRCVLCFKSDIKDNLIRVAMDKRGEVILDLNYRLPGRGVYFHKRGECRDKIKRREYKKILNMLNGREDLLEIILEGK